MKLNWVCCSRRMVFRLSEPFCQSFELLPILFWRPRNAKQGNTFSFLLPIRLMHFVIRFMLVHLLERQPLWRIAKSRNKFKKQRRSRDNGDRESIMIGPQPITAHTAANDGMPQFTAHNPIVAAPHLTYWETSHSWWFVFLESGLYEGVLTIFLCSDGSASRCRVRYHATTATAVRRAARQPHAKAGIKSIPSLHMIYIDNLSGVNSRGFASVVLFLLQLLTSKIRIVSVCVCFVCYRCLSLLQTCSPRLISLCNFDTMQQLERATCFAITIRRTTHIGALVSLKCFKILSMSKAYQRHCSMQDTIVVYPMIFILSWFQ
jgi:hypothetical protein